MGRLRVICGSAAIVSLLLGTSSLAGQTIATMPQPIRTTNQGGYVAAAQPHPATYVSGDRVTDGSTGGMSGCQGGCSGSCSGSCSSLGCGAGSLTCALNCCDQSDPWRLSNAVRVNACVEVGGWIQAGYHSESDDLFNSHPDQLNLHQSWLYAEKTLAADSCCWDWGFRGDIVYGVDSQDTQAFGNKSGNWDYLNGFDHGIYGWALPQAYVEVGRGDFSVKVGHFFTLVGYEVVTAPDNFFYSHSITMFNSEPFTHTGALATYNLSDDLTVYGGWTLGWDTGFDQLDAGSNFLGGFSSSIGEHVTVTYILTAGNFGSRGQDAYSHSVVADMKLTERLTYVLQSDLLRVGQTGEDNVGINQYFLYRLNDCFGLGARLEWWKGDAVTGYAPHGGLPTRQGSQSYYETTVGANFTPHANLTIRPEVRFDWSPAGAYDETLFGIDAYVTF